MSLRFIRKDINGISWLIGEYEYSDILVNKLKDIHAISQFLSPDPGSTIPARFVPIKTGRRKAFGIMNLLDVNGKPDIYVKIFNCASLLLKLKHLFVRSKAKKEFDLANSISLRGIPTVSVVLVGEKRRFGLLDESCLMVKKIEDAVNLKDFFYNINQNPVERLNVIEEFGRIARLSHDQGILQTDFALNNFLLQRHGNDKGFRIYLIDFERAKLCQNISRRKRIWLLAKLNRAGSDFTRTEKFRFLQAYFNSLQLKSPESRLNETINSRSSIASSRSEIIRLIKDIDRKTIKLLKNGARKVWKGCVKGDRIFSIYESRLFKGHFVNGYKAERLINLANNFDGLKKVDKIKLSDSINIISAEAELSDAKWKGLVIVHKLICQDKSYPFAAWQDSNALLRARINVSEPIGVFIRKGRSAREGFLITSYIHDTQDISDFFKNISSNDEKDAFLYRLGAFICNLHNFGGLICPLSSGDIVVKGKDKEKTYKFYFGHPYNFLLNMSLSHRERLLDIERIIHFLGTTITEDEEKIFRWAYSKNKSWYNKHD